MQRAAIGCGEPPSRGERLEQEETETEGGEAESALRSLGGLLFGFNSELTNKKRTNDLPPGRKCGTLKAALFLISI